eukprot:COSAG02_NODE_11092_length_1794_cov_2.198230_2_plen_143_part_00
MKVMGKPIDKLVVDAVTLDAKEEWLQALRLCQEIEIPEDVRSRGKKEPSVVQATSEDSHKKQGASTVLSPVESIAAFDDYGRARGDPAFGKPLGWTPGDSSSAEDSEDEDSEEEDSEEETSDDDSEEVNLTAVMFVATILRR